MCGISSSTSALPRGPLKAESAKTWWPVPQSGSSTTRIRSLPKPQPGAVEHPVGHEVVAAEAGDDVERRAASRSGSPSGRITAARCLIGRWWKAERIGLAISTSLSRSVSWNGPGRDDRVDRQRDRAVRRLRADRDA